MSINKAIILGNVGKDPQVRTLGNAAQESNKVAEFCVATTDRRKSSTGNVEEQTEWHNIVAWKQLADISEKYVKAGDKIYVEGRIRTRSWNDQNGMTRYRTEIIAERIELLGMKGDAQQDKSNQSPRATGGAWQGGLSGDQLNPKDDDLPF